MNNLFFQKILKYVVLAVALIEFGAAAEASSVIMPLSQVKAGMKGKGRTIFESNRIDEFDAEILGVMENFQPKRSMILARLSGKGLEKTGVIQGMSGSPVYIDGKLIGAVAFSFPFSKDPVAGVTPIEEMLAIEKASKDRKTSDVAELPIRWSLTLDDLFALSGSVFSSKMSAESSSPSFVPLNIPILFSGFSGPAFDRAKPFFAALGFQPVRAGAAGRSLEKLAVAGLSLQEGEAVGVQLMGGDLDMTAIGTVTYVDGNNVLAFGHPFYNLGAVDFAMTKADVITVVPSLESSFKLAASGPLVGRISQDRAAGAYGEIGIAPRLIPINVRLEGDDLSKKEFKIKIVNDRILSPALVNLALSSIVTSEERSLGNISLDFDGDIFLDKGLSVHLEDLFSGNFDNPVTNLSGIVAAVVYYLTNNEFKDVNIFRIDINIRSVEESRLCSLENVLLDKYVASPGERLRIKVDYRTLKEGNIVEEVFLQAPNLPSGTEFYLIVGDAIAMQQVERAQYRTPDFLPRNLNQLIRILNNIRKNNRIYFKIMAAKPGLFLKGEEMPNLPPALKSMFSSPRASASAPTELNRSTLSEYQLPIPYVFRGAAVIPIKIK